MILENNTQRFIFNIIKYEFAYSNKSDHYDNNWLVTDIKLINKEENSIIHKESSADILADEFKQLVTHLKSKKPFYIDFLEPYLSFSVGVKDGQYHFAFLSKTSLVNNEVVSFTTILDNEGYNTLIKEMVYIGNHYPVR